MIALLLYRTFAHELLPWVLRLATRMLAQAVNLPEPLVHSIGVFAFARVTAFEYSVGKSLCPLRLARLIAALFWGRP